LSAVKYFSSNSITKCKITKTNEMFIFKRKTKLGKREEKKEILGRKLNLPSFFE
jgi:hypothetical protein